LEAQDRPVRAEDALSFALDGEGRRIALASRSELAIAPLIGSGTRLTRATSARVLNLAFSPNGRLLATDDADHMLRVWDAASLEEKARIGHGFRIRALAFGAGGTRLRLATEDGAVREVPWLGSDLANVACSTVTRNLAPTEWRTYLPDEPPRETWAEPNGAAAGSTQTDVVYRMSYRACAGGPFKIPGGGATATATRFGTKQEQEIEVWDNDGIVNTAPWSRAPPVRIHRPGAGAEGVS